MVYFIRFPILELLVASLRKTPSNGFSVLPSAVDLLDSLTGMAWRGRNLSRIWSCVKWFSV